ncbi:MAG: M20/M25/M40 family metallo-hydrolase [Verrucomicrobia bacterium]|nr:M20/M25/M40 family metallo-hydrolase [Verrucomicrobiota bacterium]
MAAPPTSINDLLNGVESIKDQVKEIREIILANLVMMGEIPAPTFEEEARIRFFLDRFTEAGLDSISTDEVGNAFGFIRGSEGEKNILVAAHTDTVFARTVDHTVRVESSRIFGPGVADNSLGCAVVASIPKILQHLGIQLKQNVLLMGITRGLGRGDLEGIRFFMNNAKVHIDYGLFVEGAQLGRLSYTSVGMLRGEIRCNIPDEYDWTLFESSGAISILNEVITKMMAIPLPTKPKTTITFGSVSAGNSYNTVPTSGSLHFEIRSEQTGMVGKLQQSLEELTDEVASNTQAEVTLNVIARRRPGGIDFSNPLTKAARRIQESLGIVSKIQPSVGELSALIDKEIPGLTIGITKASQMHSLNENIAIDPIFSGLAQLVGILQAMDGEFFDE